MYKAVMELKEIQYMLAIAKYGSILKASEQLYIAQSSLSQFLKNYEQRCGYTFFTRTNHGLIPTKEGELYIETAKNIQQMQRKLSNQLLEVSSLKRGKIIFTLSGHRSPYLLPRLIPEFQHLYPGIQLSIKEAFMETQELLLKKAEADVAFLSLPLNDPEIPYKQITDEEIFLAVSPEYPLLTTSKIHRSADRLWIDIDDLEQENFLLYSVNHRLREFSEQLFKAFKIHPNIVQSHNNFETLIRLCEIGMGVTFIPETYINEQNHLIYLSLGQNGQHRTLVLGYPSENYRPKAVSAFSEVIVELFQKRKQECSLILSEQARNFTTEEKR